MFSGSKTLAATVVAMAILIGVGQSASAAKTIFGMFTAASGPTNLTYTNCSGSVIWNEAGAFDSNGLLVCGVRPRGNGEARTMTNCPVSAVKFRATVRTSSAVFCTSATNPWNGAMVGCQTPSIHVIASNSTTCALNSLAGFARGYGN